MIKHPTEFPRRLELSDHRDDPDLLDRTRLSVETSNKDGLDPTNDTHRITHHRESSRSR